MSALGCQINPLCALSGLFVETLVGSTGVGGGSLVTPLLVSLFGIRPTAAVGTDLPYAGLTKTVGVLRPIVVGARLAFQAGGIRRAP